MTTIDAVGSTTLVGIVVSTAAFLGFGHAVRARSPNIAPRWFVHFVINFITIFSTPLYVTALYSFELTLNIFIKQALLDIPM